MRLTRIRSRSELSEALTHCKGQFVLTNVHLDTNPAETIRLNVTADRCSYWRGAADRDTCPIDALSFQPGDPSLLMSLEELRRWQENFALVHDCMVSELLGNIPASHSANFSILTALQTASSDIDRIDTLLTSLDVETDLYQIFQRKPRAHDLFSTGDLTNEGNQLLKAFNDAIGVYSRIPELRSYSSERQARRVEDLGPRGQRFRQWMSGHPIALGGNQRLEYVDDELKPLHLSGREFCWHQENSDLRLTSVDLLCENEGIPVWCEVKMQGDSWTTAAVVQILLYGAMIASGHQQRRLERQFPARFASTRPWLAVIVEDREHKDFSTDHANAVGFCRHPLTRETLAPAIDGLHIITVRPADEGWHVTHAETIPLFKA